MHITFQVSDDIHLFKKRFYVEIKMIKSSIPVGNVEFPIKIKVIP